jgi:hypothetical protein
MKADIRAATERRIDNIRDASLKHNKRWVRRQAEKRKATKQHSQPPRANYSN